MNSVPEQPSVVPTPPPGTGAAADDRGSGRGIPEATVARLPIYLRALTMLIERGVATASSEELAVAAGVNSAKLRKDLSYLGSYGTRGVGYDVEYLRYQIAREIGLTQDWPVLIVGLGNLGQALANYAGFGTRGFRVAALIDNDPARVGRGVRRRGGQPPRRDGGPRRRARDLHRRRHHARRGRAAGGRPAGGGRRHQHPQLRAGSDLRAGRRRRPQGRPVDRAADPRLPRAAQVGRRRGGRRRRSTSATWSRGRWAHEHPVRGDLPPQRARRGPRDHGAGRRRGGEARARRGRDRARRSRRSWCRPATGWRCTPRSTASTAASRTSPVCCATSPVATAPSWWRTCTSTTTRAPWPTCSRWRPGWTRWWWARARSWARCAWR